MRHFNVKIFLKHQNGIIFVPGTRTGGGCWSAVGLAPGFTGGHHDITNRYGAPGGWQVISIDDKSCIGAEHERSVQHEGTGHKKVLDIEF